MSLTFFCLNLLDATQGILDTIFKRWEIDRFPNFLQSAAMTKTSWDVLKLKFEHRILKIHNSGKNENFVISFMGSSVTAGHDSPFNQSFPILTGKLLQHCPSYSTSECDDDRVSIGKLMSPAFEPLGINIISRNAAMGNNPCMPYDICVRTFAGSDADIVHWEQSFNCFISESDISSKSMFEQFVRQSLGI